jgi:enoyl-[acyl-carrier protein] reductase III
MTLGGEQMRFKGKVALVTGGARGIGRAIALKLAGEGSDIIVNFLRHRQAAEQTAKDIESLGVNAQIIKANVGDPEKIDSMFKFIADTYGRLDILINNAASGVARSVMDLDVKGWAWTMDINARAFLLCAQHAARLMEERGGKIVSISSLGSTFVWPSYAAVGVSKAALESLSRYMAVELAPKNICVNAVAASAVQTEALKFYSGEQMAATSQQMSPAGRMVTPEDIASVVAFLCSEEAFMIRGQTITIDGGISLAPFAIRDEELHE